MVIKLVYHYRWIFWHCLFTSKLWEIKLATILLLGEKRVLKLTLSKHSNWSQVLPSCLSLLCNFQTQTPKQGKCCSSRIGDPSKGSLLWCYGLCLMLQDVWSEWAFQQLPKHLGSTESLWIQPHERCLLRACCCFVVSMWQRMLWERGAYSAALMLHIRCENVMFPKAPYQAKDSSRGLR